MELKIGDELKQESDGRLLPGRIRERKRDGEINDESTAAEPRDKTQESKGFGDNKESFSSGREIFDSSITGHLRDTIPNPRD